MNGTEAEPHQVQAAALLPFSIEKTLAPRRSFTTAVQAASFLRSIASSIESSSISSANGFCRNPTAERRTAAANARIGLAKAAFYPDLTMSANVGLESTFFAPWLTAPSLFWSLGPQLVGTLFDGGKRTAALHGANAQYDATVADYRQSVQTIALSNERHDALIQARRLDASVQLLKAPGGGWNRTDSMALQKAD